MKKGTAILEYGLLIAIVIAALIAIQFYFKRAINGNWKAAGDVFGSGRQYDPAVTK
jgi:Flp pilus assembly pilin Flp